MENLKARELRIGNYLELDYPIIDKIITVGCIGKNTINKVNINKFKPIPLTEDILLKCPNIIFNHKSIITKNYTIYLGRDRYLSLNDIGLGNEIIALCSKNDNTHDDVTIIHNRDFDGRMTLHKFQNLYFALTNEELTIKL